MPSAQQVLADARRALGDTDVDGGESVPAVRLTAVGSSPEAGSFAWKGAYNADVPGIGGLVVGHGITEDGRPYLTVLDDCPSTKRGLLPERLVKYNGPKGTLVRLVAKLRLFVADVDPALTQEATNAQLGGWAAKCLITSGFLRGTEQAEMVLWAGELLELAKERRG